MTGRKVCSACGESKMRSMKNGTDRDGCGAFFAKVVAGVLLLSATVTVEAAGPDAAEGGILHGATFFTQFVKAGGPIVWVILIPMSIVMVYLAIELCVSIRRNVLLPAGIGDEIAGLAKDTKPELLAAKLSERTDLISRVIVRVISRLQHSPGDKRYAQQLAAEALHEHSIYMLRKVEWCGIIGNVAPMVGLFGTVFGMIKAFNILGVAGGQPRPDRLAEAISIALITTFWGLLVAIPALAMHGIFRAKVEAVIGEAAIELETQLRHITLFSAPTQPGTPPGPVNIKRLKRSSGQNKIRRFFSTADRK